MHVDREVADWLVPQDDLWGLVSGMLLAGEDITARVIASEFQVTKPIARVALDRLARVQGLQVA